MFQVIWFPNQYEFQAIWFVPLNNYQTSRVGIVAVAVAVSPDIVTENILVHKILLPRTSYCICL